MSLLPSPLSTWQKALQTKPDSAVANQIIEEYISFFGLQSAKEELWLLTAATLTNDAVEQNKTANSRADLLFYYEFTKMLLEAVYVLHGGKGGVSEIPPSSV